jgi:hypothetical protein
LHINGNIMNVHIDDELIANLSNLNANKAIDVIIDEALRLYLTIENQKKLLSLKGKIALDVAAFD